MVYVPRYCVANDVYAKTGLSSIEVDFSVGNNMNIIEDAEFELEMLTGRRYDGANVMTDFVDGASADVIGRSVPNSFAMSDGTGSQINYGRARGLRVSNYPLQSVTAFNRLNIDGTTAKSYATLTSVQIAGGTTDTVDYWLELQYDVVSRMMVPNGRIILKTEDVIPGVRNYQVGYTFGYTAVPVTIRDLASCLAGIRAWVKFMGGCYNRLDSYSVPQQNVSKGSFYDRCVTNIANLRKEADDLLDRIGRRSRTLFFGSGGSR